MGRPAAQQIRLDQLVTTKDTLDLATLLDAESTFFGDLFAHVVNWHEELYLEDGLHRALRAALQQRNVLHARVHLIKGVGVIAAHADHAAGAARRAADRRLVRVDAVQRAAARPVRQGADAA